MDLAFRTFKANNKNGIIINLDADTRVSENYLISIETHFEKNPKTEAASIYFEHDVENHISNNEQLAVLNYELHLRYFINMQRIIELPYAYQTIGSAMAVRSFAYAKERGMNKRQAGEDFYFLHKFTKNESLSEINSAVVRPSHRSSDRVPFGTGKAIQDMISESSIKKKSYNPESFVTLKKWTKQIFETYPNLETSLIESDSMVYQFLKERKQLDRIQEITTNTNSYKSFKKRFFQWFDAFMLMKYLHYARDNSFPDIPIDECLSYLFGELELEFSGDLYDSLQKLRYLDKNNIK